MSAQLVMLMRMPWYARLHEFNLLPSRLLHASWWSRFAPHGAIELIESAAGNVRSVHRHWSASILRELGLQDTLCVDAQAPQLPLAILPRAAFERLVMTAGAVLVGQRIRQSIRRDDVVALAHGIDAELLRFTRLSGASLHPGAVADRDQPIADVIASIEVLGAGLLWCALRDAPREMRERARLRLPLSAADHADAAGLEPDGALSLSLRLLEETDPTWLSGFTTTA